MPSKVQDYTQLSEQAAKQITGSYRDWTAFLTTAARLYKYPYHEQLMIYAQRPDAVACADYDLWNKHLRRYVRRGSKGIALIDDSGDTPKLRYVFDVSDTGGGENSRRPYLWEYRTEHSATIADALERQFSVDGADGLEQQLEAIAAQLADEYWHDHRHDLLDIVDGSFLEDYDEFNIGVQFRNAATVSITYSLMSRCGLEPNDYFEHEDFLSIFDFNTPAAMSFLGTAVSDANQRVLRQIEITIKNYERSKAHEQSDIQHQRGLSDSRPDPDGEQPALGQVRTDEENLSQGASDGDLQSSAPVGQADSAPDGDRPNGHKPPVADDSGAGGSAERDRGLESQRPDEMGGADEQPESAGRGNNSVGADLQLSFFPTEAQQIRLIDEAESIAPSAFSISQEDLDAELRRGSGYEGGKLRIYAAFQSSSDPKERATFLKNEYNYYGHSHTYLDGSGGFVDYSPGKGMEMSRNKINEKTTVSYSKIATRIAELIAADEYLTPAEKEQYAELEGKYAGLGGVPTPFPRMGFPEPPEAQPVPDAAPRDMTQADMDAAIQAWNGDITSKHTVIRHMENHARDRDTAAFLRNEYGGDLTAFPVTVDGVTHDVPWPKVQRRIFQLMADDRFYTQAEQDGHDDIDPIAIREALAQRGIVNGEVVDPEALNDSPFIQQVTADVAQITAADELPYSVGDTLYLEDSKAFIVESIGKYDVQLRDPTLFYPIFRAESKESLARLLARYPQQEQSSPQPEMTAETVAVYPGDKNNLPYDIVIERLHFDEPEHSPSIEAPAAIQRERENFRITDDNLGVGSAGQKYAANIAAIRTLKTIEAEGRSATPVEQEILSRYVGWGGLADCFKPDHSKNAELRSILTDAEYEAARESTLNAHYTSPTVIKAIYETVENMGFRTGNILEPACGVGNFFGLLPERMAHSRLYGTELDSITGRIARQLYPNADIQVAGFETTDRRDFYDLAIGNVPFGQYKVADKPYDKLGFSIHDYFFAKAIDQVRPGGVVAFVTSRYTMDKKSPEVRRYIAQRAELLGAIRLHNNAFKANAGTEVVSDILFLQKRDRPIVADPEWVHLGQTPDGLSINSFFVENPQMVLGTLTTESTQYGREECTVIPIPGADLADQLRDAVSHINGEITEAELPDLGEGEAIDASIPADPNVKNYSYTVVDGEVFYRENSRMVRPELNATAAERVKGMVELRDCVQSLIGQQLDGYSDAEIADTQAELNRLYDSYTAKYGLINSRGNSLAFSDDSSYFLLCSLEVLDEDGELERKADMFTKRTIRPNQVVTSVDTASEALALSISEKAFVDMEYMTDLTGKSEDELASELRGVIFRVPRPHAEGERPAYAPADEYLSGNVRQKLELAGNAAEEDEIYRPNVEALELAQPKDLDASEIDVRLGATWIDRQYIQEFMYETFQTPRNQRAAIDVHFSNFFAEWNISGKSAVSWNDVAAFTTFGIERASAYRILEDTLNLRDTRIYDYITDPDGSERRVLNRTQTALAQQKQQAIKDAFRDWIFNDPERRQTLVALYNERFNSIRPREYDGSHITFGGINPEISLRTHQLNAIAHILYGGNTLLAHEVGAGKTFEMVAAAMESKRLGLCTKSLFAVPNHLTEQWASEFLRLYPSANILVTTKKDFETRNRKKFCARIATGDYDAVIMGHSQFERLPVSKERQEQLIQEQIWEIEDGLEELKRNNAENFTIKQLERTKKNLQTRLKKLNDTTRKDDVITFEQLGIDRLYVDEAHNYKNLFLYTKMRNVAGLSTTEAQKSSDMLLKCRYIDEKTDSKGVVFATGTPVSNSMTELYTMQRYLQHDILNRNYLNHFDSWASTFGETVTAIELAPEGTGYRARTRFAKFFNLPELMNMFKETADIKTADQLDLPTPTAIYHNEVAQPTEQQKEMVQDLSERAKLVHSGTVDPSKDNMLKITSDGRKLGLDQRIVNPTLPDDPGSKVNLCVDNITRIWKDGQSDKLTQLVFCDMSTPKKDGSFTVYDDIRSKLIANGIPPEEIAFIHDANTETRKKELFAKVRSGQVRVLMGSTFKMGAGMNVQDRLVALHDLDCPWRPGDLEQRSGRIIRQGNTNPEVHIYRYVTEGTFDSYLWQTVENKQKFISQIMTSKSPVRSCEDVDEQALSYAEIKALCAGNPLIKEKMDLDIEVARLRLLKASHQSQQYKLEDNILKNFPQQIKSYTAYVAAFQADLATLAAHPLPGEGFVGMTVKGDALTDKDNAGAAILEACKDIKDTHVVEIGAYRGLPMSIAFDSKAEKFSIQLKGKMTYVVNLGEDARGNLTRIDNELARISERLTSVEKQLENLHHQTAAAKAELGKPFPQEAELEQKSARLAMLDIQLNMANHDEAQQASPTLTEERLVSKSARPSVLANLKNPCLPGKSGKAKKAELEVR